MPHILYILLAVGFLLAGQGSVVLASVEQTPENKSEVAAEESVAGKALFEQHCLACHQPRRQSDVHGPNKARKKDSAASQKGKQQHADRLAPPMPMVKKHYLDSYPQREDFIEAVVSWIADPKPEKAQLHKAVKRFGLMQALPLDLNTREQIATYIYDQLPKGHCPKHKQGHLPE